MSSQAVTIVPTLANCDKFTTLDCLRALYKINYTPVATHKNSFGIGSMSLFLRNNVSDFFVN